ncbi:sensor histidine kinase [Halomonas elongata]|uniref:histidine kinase n=2 Tax=Halomonas elongata TaxID=2746 RepID=E1V7G1_HALED|nr:sensor histidine kinase [Halomonas elongata]WBF18746.1 sensor histidine kinase N-terminal domain-containing protein [Halomonas elongata]WPU47602.1 sensor histidine kinase N-terminal domain-containing protein [Halomonas elongata DSM 2581]CBV41511.1 sensor histidine kinase [Halomonas elongata DSM 2581]
MIEVDGSLKRRLAIWLLVTVSGLGTLLMIEAYLGAQRAAQRAYDSQLEAAALTIAESVQWREGEPVLEIPAAALQILATRHQERVFYAVLDADGRRISANLPLDIAEDDQHHVAREPFWRDVTWRGEDWRLYGREYDSAGWETQDPVQIWVGHTMAGRRALAGELFERAVTRFLAMVLLAGLLMLLAMRVALTPMRRLRQLLRRRDADDMGPLDARVPEELRELAETLDTLFSRQRDSRDALLRFTADASHQLKTPLAGLQSTSELALAQDDPETWRTALVDVNEGAARTSRLASQLLSLARLRHVGGDGDMTHLDLAAMLREVTLDWAGRDAAREHDLGLAELPSAPVVILGSSWALRELLGNLIDNALTYTPAGSEITLGIEIDTRVATLYIEDDGPGVPVDLLERLHHPFERGGRQDTRGSGLGLAVVDSIAKRHGAAWQVSNREPRGLRVTLRFTLSSPEER